MRETVIVVEIEAHLRMVGIVNGVGIDGIMENETKISRLMKNI